MSLTFQPPTPHSRVNRISSPTRQIRAGLPRTEVLIFAMHDSETMIAGLLKAGARGYVLKSDSKRYLIGAIESLAGPTPFFTSQVSEALLRSFSTKPNRSGSTLTNRARSLLATPSATISSRHDSEPRNRHRPRPIRHRRRTAAINRGNLTDKTSCNPLNLPIPKSARPSIRLATQLVTRPCGIRSSGTRRAIGRRCRSREDDIAGGAI